MSPVKQTIIQVLLVYSKSNFVRGQLILLLSNRLTWTRLDIFYVKIFRINKISMYTKVMRAEIDKVK